MTVKLAKPAKQTAVSELRILIELDDTAKMFKRDKTAYIEYIYCAYESEVEEIRNRYNYGLDEFYSVMKKI